ncbi:MAG: isoleucine--tRNA ligase [Ruminococcaceae bacterium]|nr:isoleucine--tRNA ligase [Oscillospiraceae bacterium]
MAEDYNKTLNLPETEFPMRASLPQREPAMLEQWLADGLYELILKKNEGRPRYILHDGPPYANGDIHLGTALNKTLKDIVVRFKNMSGFCSPFVPGWDTHGLPTELKARKKAGLSAAASLSPNELRALCREFVDGYIDDQRNQFKRLGCLGEWVNPYITMLPAFEAKQIEIFCEMACSGHIYKGLKPVYWCPDCKTALAEAEIEYAEDPCLSIYVKFKVVDDKGKLTALGADLDNTYFVIWTTTTWTLPGNTAICVGPRYTYKLIKANGETYIMADGLYENAMKAAGITEYEVVGEISGAELEYMQAQHPFLDRKSLVLVGDHVTLESGTGCVHTAPGHGVDDYIVCRNYPEVPIIVPVNADGVLTEEAAQFAGLNTEQANKAIAAHMEETGALFAFEKIEHKYPHCWRCKNPVLFRATEQWFCSVDSFKDKAVEAIHTVKWVPGWGEDRIASMVRERNDWCISRQRRWGVPIPIFYCAKCGKEHIDREAIMAVSKLFAEFGSDVWYARSAEELLPAGTVCSACGASEFTKENDIMDVWFDSGVTHAAVCDERDYLDWPADLYLEGADQYRGWFQSSLLTSVAWRGVAPYKTVVTHGWVVDGKGEKMSKSLGNGIEPREVVDKYGADILRLWVASSDYHCDIRISDDILKQLSESYRKIRNTARYILGNIAGFNPDTDSVAPADMQPLDRWALARLNDLINQCMQSYESFEFYQVYHAINRFCVVDMSNFYLDVLKDRLYCDGKDSASRRAAQTAMFIILDALVKLIAPILAYTSDEIWKFMPHRATDDARAVMLNDMPKPVSVELDEGFVERWDRIHAIRDDVQRALENARKTKLIGKSLEAKVTLFCEGELAEFVRSVAADLPQVFIVSHVDVVEGKCEDNPCDVEGLGVKVEKAEGAKCERCWIYSDTVGANAEHPTLCQRCADVVSGK